MVLEQILRENVIKAFAAIYQHELDVNTIQFQQTRKEFEGDITLVVFPFLRFSKKGPEQTAEDLGAYLAENVDIVDKYNVVKGFLNIVVSPSYYLSYLQDNMGDDQYGMKQADENSKLIMVEYSSPNTNKPLHLGHIRNNLLGYSLCKILEANGNKVVKTNIVNDRGIHICKSMLAWQKFGNGETPESANLKGDHLVGKYYVIFDQENKKQVAQLVSEGMQEEEAAKNTPLLKEAQEMLRKWEAKDEEVYELWKTMNNWVYDGFDVTYKRLGVGFDKIYYESDTYLVGRDTVLEGLKNNVLYQRDDSSVWADLTKDGLDEKILLRSDGTSVYMTQDIGTAQLRQKDYSPDKMVYVVGNEQNYHFKVLSIVLDKLGYSWANDLHHMSYGMVELPEGKMKSREGTVVDADDLMDEMIETARSMGEELGKLEGLSEEEKKETFRIIGLGALKYFILKVDPVKNMTFNPKESIDFNGNTGPFIQYTYARIQSVFRKAKEQGIEISDKVSTAIDISDKERSLLKLVYNFPSIINEAASNYSPALVANYTYELVKEYNQFYHDHFILKEEVEDVKQFRLQLSKLVGEIVKNSMSLLGIEVPSRM
ncbi:MAG: arginine--tRNA ligase [Bacteroidales bacterium]|nr:arginine--tRNA ligase [Bacteroidales bacterium]